MLKLYDVNHNLLDPIMEEFNVYKESSLTMDSRLLYFSLPADLATNVVEEGYVRTSDDEYVIKELQDNDDNTVSFVAKYNIEALEGKLWEGFDSVEQTVYSCATGIIKDTGWTVKTSSITKKRTMHYTDKFSAEELLEKACTLYACNIIVDTLNKTLEFVERRGSDKGVYFMEDLNLIDISRQGNSYDFYTRLVAEGKTTETTAEDGTVTTTTLKLEVSNHDYSEKVKTFYWKDERYTVYQSLLEDATLKLEDMAKPYRTYSTKVIDLPKLDSATYGELSYSIGDTVTLLSKSKRYRDTQRIIKMVEYRDYSEDNTIELGSPLLTFSDVSAMRAEVSASDLTITEDDIREPVTSIIQDYFASGGSGGSGDVSSEQFAALSVRVSTLESTVSRLDNTMVTMDYLNEELSKYCTKENFEVETAKIGILEANFATINDLVAGNITAENIDTQFLAALQGWMLEGSIGNAQIASLSATKITSGTIDTSKVQVIGPNGRLKLSGNKIQVFDIQSNGQLYERLFMGIDDTNNAMFLVRSSDGETVYFDINGITKAGFTDGYDKVDDGTLDAAKFDFKTIVTGINGSTETINSTSVTIENMTLDAYFRQMNTTQTNLINGINTTLESHGSSIKANENSIKLKVDTQVYQSDLEKINQSLTTQSARIDVLNDNISLGVTQNELVTYVTDSVRYNANMLSNSTWNLGINYDWLNNTNFSLLSPEVDKPSSHILKITKSSLTTAGWFVKACKNIYVEPGTYLVSADIKVVTKPDYANTVLVFRCYSTDTTSTAEADAVWYDRYNIPDNIALNTWVRVSKVIEITRGNYLKVGTYLSRNGDVRWREILLKKGSQEIDWIPAYTDDSGYIGNIEDSLDAYKSEVSDQFKAYDTKLDNILADVGGAITDGIIDDAEILALQSSIQELKNSKTDLYSQVKYLRAKSVLPTASKTALNTAYSNFQFYHNRLIHTMNEIIDKGINLIQMTDDTFNIVGTNAENQTTAVATIPDISKLRGYTVVTSYDWLMVGNSSGNISGAHKIQTTPNKWYSLTDSITVSTTNYSGTSTKTVVVPLDTGVADTNMYNSLQVRSDNLVGTLKVTNLRVMVANTTATDTELEQLRKDFEYYYNIYRDRLDSLRAVIADCVDDIAEATATNITSSQISTLESSIDIKLGQITQSVSSNSSNITTLSGRYDTLNSTMSGISSDLAAYKTIVSNEFSDVRKSVSDLNSDINTTIKDGWIDEAECITLNRAIERLTIEYEEVCTRVEALLGNDAVANSSTTRTNLTNKYNYFKTAHTNYVTFIRNLISKGNVTDTDRTSLTTYQTAYSSRLADLNSYTDVALNQVSYTATVSEVNSAKAEIKNTTDSITTRVNTVASRVTDIEGEITSQDTIIKEVQTQVTDSAFTIQVLKRLNTVFKVRYIRDTISTYTTTSGSTGTNKYWYDISVYNNLGVNVAKGITPTCTSTLNNPANICDGKLNTYGYATGTGNATLTIDLGSVYQNLDRVRILHATNRIYRKVLTEFSEDGTTWYTLYDSDVSGTYNELTYGHTYNLNGTGVSNTRVSVNESGLQVYGGSITILNNNDEEVLQGDSSGNLSMTGTFTSYSSSSGYRAVGMNGSNVYIYNWGKDGSLVGSISSNALLENGVSNTDKPAMSLNHQTSATATIGYLVSGSTYNTYVTFDKYNIRNSGAPVVFAENCDFNARIDGHGGNLSLWNGWDFFPLNTYGGYHGYGTYNGEGMHWIHGGMYVDHTFNVGGSKNRIVSIDDGTKISMGAYETTTPYFGDIGEGQTDNEGVCYIYIDEIFLQTVHLGNYQVFISKYGRGDVWVEERTAEYFKVCSDNPHIKFAWEVKARQKGYENDRMEIFAQAGEIGKQEEEKLARNTVVDNVSDEDKTYHDIYDNIDSEEEDIINSLLGGVQ